MILPLYLQDSYLKTCTAEILAADRVLVQLSQSVCYPRGGGQPSDEGVLTLGADSYQIVSVFSREGVVWHELDRVGPAVGDSVTLTLDWERRYRLMRMHTASHVLAGVLHTETGALITGNQLGLEKSRVDFNLSDYDPAVLQGLIVQANAIVVRGGAVDACEVSRAKAESMPAVAKLAKGLHPSVERIRLVTLTGCDQQACGGTHVKDLSEVGVILFLKGENKGKGNRRVYFTLSE